MTGPETVRLRVRTATTDDARLLLDWRNDPEARSRSRSDDVIDLDSHLAWLERTLASPDRHLLVVETDEGTPVATTRYDRLAPAPDGTERWEVSISVAPGMRGRGLGGATLRASDEWLRAAEPGVAAVVAHVRPDNTSSRRLFLRSGYRPAPSEEPDMDRFVRHWGT
jgi:RimJ/RimL family protein N-acetyltransferase